MRLRFALEIVGGPFDGAPGLLWVTVTGEDRVDPPPVLMLNRCPGDRRCRLPCDPRGHVAFWAPEFEDAPAGSIEYELEQDSVMEFAGRGHARYAYGRLGSFYEFEALAGARGSV